MNSMIFDISPEKYNTLSDSERFLLKYIYDHLEEISTMSIVKLSEHASVSTATIVRLMKKIGYDGYTSFKYSIQEKIAKPDTHNELDDIDLMIKQAIIKNEHEVIKTIQMLSIGTIEDAIQKIHDSEKIYIFARGFSEMIANEMTMKFQLLGKNCEMHNDPNIIRVISQRLKDREMAIFISLSGETNELVEACKNLRINNISTITLTTKMDSTLAKMSELIFLGYKDSHSFFPDYEVRSRLPLQVISRVLLDAYAIRMK
ncbi:MurR/RpiR family transcriptional regulator [Paucisalibacillus globulus]|uniref:MurR/RpiR family transcriptional regulator n=1 Tax=Paucisalibacillus globulus TaxID=351095 RepID=UPI0003FCD672|nr:MurR/RpiR family transcriptional regulator [Paucisalibacillus globulus]